MKKTLFFGLIAATLGFTACSSEDDAILGENSQKKGMVLNASVEQTAETRATMTENASNYDFAFANGDVVKVTNSAVTSGTYYTFTNDGTNFKSTDAETTAAAANWFAYFPSNSITLTGQDGTLAGVANLYALVGTTASTTTGEEGLSIAMSPKVAILKIDNQKGSIDIQVKTSATNYVTGLTAKSGEAGFDVSTNTTPTSLFTTTTTGDYYVAVPAGVQLSVKDGNTVIKSTGINGLTAGKYYNLTVSEASTTTGTAKATIGSTDVDVNWVQLWAGGPKFAEYNVGVTDGKATSYGGYYCWGSSINKDSNHAYNSGYDALTGTDDTATNLWGSNWRMPTKAELDGLLANCDVAWTTVNGVNGCKFTGKGVYASNSVFLPAAGYCYYGDVYGQGNDGNYWSSTPNGRGFACNLGFDSGYQGVGVGSRSFGYSVRAVLAE